MSAARIPLGANRRGRAPTAWALVDAADHELVAGYSWHLHGQGYAARNERHADGTRRLVLMHRQLLGLEPGDGFQADHINGDRLDNRRGNLRTLTQAENLQNLRPKGATGIRGVRRHGRRWRAEAHGRHLGTFATSEEADAAVRAYRAQHMPFADPDTDPEPIAA